MLPTVGASMDTNTVLDLSANTHVDASIDVKFEPLDLSEDEEDKMGAPTSVEIKEDEEDGMEVPVFVEVNIKEEPVDAPAIETTSDVSVEDEFPIESVFIKVEDVKCSISGPVLTQHRDTMQVTEASSVPRVEPPVVVATDTRRPLDAEPSSPGIAGTVVTRRLYSCVECPVTFFKEADLERHRRSHLSEPVDRTRPRWKRAREKTFECPECKKLFSKNSQLTIHSRVHTGEKPYKCGVCDRSFHWSTSLSVHQRTHTGEREFDCPTCSLAFSSKSNLSQHLVTHSGARPFGCAECGRSFTQNSQLTIHKRVHSGERPFPCDTCGKSFVSRSHLTKHTRVHTDERPFVCPACGKSFHWSNSLNVHKCLGKGGK